MPKLTLAVADHDLNRALIDGAVRPTDLELDVLWDMEDGARHARMLAQAAFDACEFSFANYLIAKSQGRPLTGIPAFPNRKFRHSYIFCNTRANIRAPRDLEGKRVGLRGWAATASLWVRGILQRFYDVDLTKIQWYAPADPIEFALPSGIQLTRLSEGQDLDAMLVAGELDTVIYPDVLPSIQRGAPEVKRLFEDYKSAEQEFFRRTQIFPISHLVVIKQEVAEKYPWVPASLLRAFRRSRDACFQRLEEQQVISLAWSNALLAEQRALMGHDYWPYNVAANRHVLETLLSFASEQQLTSRAISVEELFAPDAAAEPGA